MEDKTIVVAQKTMHKGMLFGAISNGGATIPLSDNYGVRFICMDGTFVVAQVIKAEIGSVVRHQTWVKPKIVKEKVVVEKKTATKKDEYQQVQFGDAGSVELL